MSCFTVTVTLSSYSYYNLFITLIYVVMVRTLKMNHLNASSSELDFDGPNIEDYLPSDSIQEPCDKIRLFDLLDISPTLKEAVSTTVDDSFTRCFKSNPPEPWNWNMHLFPLWCLGVAVRHMILFPMRLAFDTVE
ncbi:hypothetical protein Vadar_008019 [Vaccinium darrowii]|uniref:Uncharacterized protein n=1 Tax=Vaccinium darrowii TaxID=229202 RepID=A0ACB7WYV2_9ERIC|nr:hypothetical protein Vadar_008019 [Vaccinium darrowii]